MSLCIHFVWRSEVGTVTYAFFVFVLSWEATLRSPLWNFEMSLCPCTQFSFLFTWLCTSKACYIANLTCVICGIVCMSLCMYSVWWAEVGTVTYALFVFVLSWKAMLRCPSRNFEIRTVHVPNSHFFLIGCAYQKHAT